jgi:uncharacterized protein (TIGR03083 family)
MAFNPMDYSAKDTMLDVLRTEREKFYNVIDDPANWNVQTRCTEWEVRDIVGHMINVTEDIFLAAWERARNGQEPVAALGMRAAHSSLNKEALARRYLSRDEAIARLKAASDKMLSMFDALTADEWSNFIVGHLYAGPLPACFYLALHIMDYGIHTWDMRWGLGDKQAKLDERTAGVLTPFIATLLYSGTLTPELAEGVDVVYGIQVDGNWGGCWKLAVKDGECSAQVTGDFSDAQAVFHYAHPSDLVLSAFQRDELGEATGETEVIDLVPGLFFKI